MVRAAFLWCQTTFHYSPLDALVITGNKRGLPPDALSDFFTTDEELWARANADIS